MIVQLATHTSLARTDVKEQLEAAFWQAYMPSDDKLSDQTLTLTCVGLWVPAVRYLAAQNSTTRLALDSCALMALGRERGDSDHIRQGMVAYGLPLRATNAALQHPRSARALDTLATCHLLGLCEKYREHEDASLSTQGTDYQMHVQGTAKLLEIRGPEAHVEANEFALFANARSSIALSGITRRRKALLSDRQWLEVPWSYPHRKRTLRTRLVDASLAVASVLELQDSCLPRSPPGNANSHRRCATLWQSSASR